MKRQSLIQAYTDDGKWMAEAITPDGNRPLNRCETLRFVCAYIKSGNGSLMKRLSSVLIKAITLRLKPSQLSFENNNTNMYKADYESN